MSTELEGGRDEHVRIGIWGRRLVELQPGQAAVWVVTDGTSGERMFSCGQGAEGEQRAMEIARFLNDTPVFGAAPAVVGALQRLAELVRQKAETGSLIEALEHAELALVGAGVREHISSDRNGKAIVQFGDYMGDGAIDGIVIVAGGRRSPGLLASPDPSVSFDSGNGATPGARMLARAILMDYLANAQRVERIENAFAQDFIGKLPAGKWVIPLKDLAIEILRLESQGTLLP